MGSKSVRRRKMCCKKNVRYTLLHMRLFALDTAATRKICQRYCIEVEAEILLTRYHWLSFFIRAFREFLFATHLPSPYTFATHSIFSSLFLISVAPSSIG